MKLEDEDTEIDPLSAIIDEFNRQYRLPGMDEEVTDRIIRSVPNLINKNKAYRNAKQNADPENVRVELLQAVEAALLEMSRCSAEFFAKPQSTEGGCDGAGIEQEEAEGVRVRAAFGCKGRWQATNQPPAGVGRRSRSVRRRQGILAGPSGAS